jgi:phosphotransferase system HPr (HPr) family protein
MSERKLAARRALHARPASLLAKLATEFDAEVALEVAGRTANAKSVLSLMALDLEAGDDVLVRARGTDAKRALEAISTMLSSAEAKDG